MAHYADNNVNAGAVKEIEEICVDRFLRQDLKSSVFFLSHAHTDHMAGLDTTEFLERLQEPDVRLYCHPLTIMLVGEFGRYIGGKENIEKLIRSEKIVPRDVEQPFCIKLRRGQTFVDVTVTLLPAGHCPGSVMFLFEMESRRILHTADFRLSKEDIRGMNSLHIGTDLNKIVKTIDYLYVDTTFCYKAAASFPDRKLALDEVSVHLSKWIKGSELNVIRMEFAARFAHEYILMEVFKKFGKPVHVDEQRFVLYQQIPGLEDCVTLEQDTPFHFCRNQTCFHDRKSLEVKFTSQWYTIATGESRSGVRVCERTSRVNVCYAMHSSLTEVAAIIDYLQPKVVIPFVKPVKDSLDDVGELLKSHCSHSFLFFKCAKQAEIDSPRKSSSQAITMERYGRRRQSSTSSVSMDSPVKRPKLSPEYEWNYPWTPSPKTSCGSGSSRDNSQEMRCDP